MRTIGFDLDGVLYDFHRVCYNHLVTYHKLTRPYKQFWQTGYSDYDYSVAFWDSIVKIPILYEKLNIGENELYVLNELSQNNIIVYITHRPSEVKFVTEQWMKFNKLPQRSNLYFASGSKINLVVRNSCDYFIDDRYKIVKELEFVTNAILFKKVWHTQEELNSVTYIKSLTELLEIKL